MRSVNTRTRWLSNWVVGFTACAAVVIVGGAQTLAAMPGHADCAGLKSLAEKDFVVREAALHGHCESYCVEHQVS